MFFKRILLVLILVCATLFSSIHNAQAAFIGTKQEIELGAKVAADLEKKYGLLNDPEMQERLSQIGQTIAAVSDRQDLKYSFKILNNNEINALAVPGGYIYVFKGLIDYMPTEEELAGVLAHEVTHIAKKHSVNQMEKQMWTTALTMIGAAISGSSNIAAMAPYLNEAIMAGYSRNDERQADSVGFSYMLRAKRNPYGMYVTMRKLNDIPNKPNYGLFSSHPDTEDRLNKAKSQAESIGIKPKVLADKNIYRVTDGRYTLPVGATVGSNKSEYRAYLLAGGLHNIVQQNKNIDPYRFISLSSGERVDIYYDDIYLYSIYPQDVTAQQGSANTAANDYIELLRTWAVQR